MKEPVNPVFLARSGYRWRRLIDAARLLPVVGIVLVFLPVLWTAGGESGLAQTARGGIYVFVVWAVLIFGAAILSRPLSRRAMDRDEAQTTHRATPGDRAVQDHAPW